MAMAVVPTENPNAKPIQLVKFAWTSASDGSAEGTTVHAYNGKCELLTTVPAAAGDAPSDDYDVSITDENGVDVLGSGGANRDTANTEQVLGTSLGAVASSKLTLNIANAGDSKAGVVYLYVRG